MNAAPAGAGRHRKVCERKALAGGMRQVRSDEIERMQEDIVRLGPWRHDILLPGGLRTAPDEPRAGHAHALWRTLADHLPPDMAGMSVLDVGCNAGYFSFELARRGAEVLGVDPDPRCLEQARWARKKLGLHAQVRFRRMQVYDLAQYERSFDVVLCLGVFPQLRYPMLALDILARKSRQSFVFQSLKRRGGVRAPAASDVSKQDLSPLERQEWPCLAFLPGALDDDPGHWWIPNHEGVVAMLQSAGLQLQRRIDGEIYMCRPEPGGDAEWNTVELLSATGRPWRKLPSPRFDGATDRQRVVVPA